MTIGPRNRYSGNNHYPRYAHYAVTIFMGASFYDAQTRAERAREQGGHQWERERDRTLRLPAPIVWKWSKVLEFLHFIPRTLNGVPQSLTLWDFMWNRAEDPVYRTSSPVFPSYLAVSRRVESRHSRTFVSPCEKKEAKKHVKYEPIQGKERKKEFYISIIVLRILKSAFLNVTLVVRKISFLSLIWFCDFCPHRYKFCLEKYILQRD